MLMTHAQPVCEAYVEAPSEVITALKNLYIVSSALAQRGTYAQEIRDSQWRTLAQRVAEAKTALDEHQQRPETHAVALLREMTRACEDLIELHATRQGTPFAVWREVGRLGHDAYESVNATAPHRRGSDA
jgi:hypothetical protein